MLKIDKIMIVAHPDDESIFGGNSLLSESGWRVVCLSGGHDKTRLREFKSAMRMANVEEYEVWNFEDSLNKEFPEEAKEVISLILKQNDYKKIVTHSEQGEYGHIQHKSLHSIVKSVCDKTKLFYFGFSDERLSQDRIDRKLELLRSYQSQKTDYGKDMPLLPSYEKYVYCEKIINDKLEIKKENMDQGYINSILNNRRIEWFDDYNGINVLHGLYDLIKENFNENFIICEIGSFAGVSSELFALTCKKVFCVDPWLPYEDIDQPERLARGEPVFDERMQKYDNIIKIKKKSMDAYSDFEDYFFDAIYIDALHFYESVKEDVVNWLSKIKKDGFICGHDYTFFETPGVKRAVDEVFSGCNIRTYSDGSWLVSLKEYYDMKDNDPIKKAYKIGMSQDKKEISDFFVFAKNHPVKNVMEIGTDKGGTFSLLVSLCPREGKKISVDVPQWRWGSVDYDIGDRNRVLSILSDNVHLVEGNSHEIETLNKVASILNGEKLDILFIDGDHSEEGVSLDYSMYKNFVREGGIIAFHDIKDSQFHTDQGCFVSRFWNKLDCPNKIEFVNAKSSFGGIGCIYAELNNERPIMNEQNNEMDKSKMRDKFIFIIDTWIDNIEKEEVLKKLILDIKEKYEIDILLVSHSPVSFEVQSLVNYFIYDKNNPLLLRENYKDFGIRYSYLFSTSEYNINVSTKFRHDYSIWLSWKNAFNFAKYLNKENIIFMEFDWSIDIEKIGSEFMYPLDKYKACLLPSHQIKEDKNDKRCMTSIFSIKTDVACDIVNSISGKDDYFSVSVREQKFILESLFSHLLIGRSGEDSIYMVDGNKYRIKELDHIGDDCKIKYSIFFCRDSENYCYIVFNSFILINYINDKDICVLYSGVERFFRPSGDSAFYVMGLGYMKDIRGDISIKYNSDIIVKMNQDEIKSESLSGEISPKEGLSLDKFRNSFVKIDENNTKDNIFEQHIQKKNKHFQKDKDIRINLHFIDGPFVEILGDNNKTYDIIFESKDESVVLYRTRLPVNHWGRANRKWFTNWITKIECDGEEIFYDELDLYKQRVMICIDSKSMGDNIAWIPYIEEFRKKHNCIVFCSTFWNSLFEKEYPEINFISPGSVVDSIYARYIIGFFSPVDYDKSPINPKIIPLQKVAADILGICNSWYGFDEIVPKITIPNSPRNIDGKYVCIGVHSTAQCKYWNYPGGWQIIVDYLKSLGYKVVNISGENGSYMGNDPPSGVIDKSGRLPIEDRMIDIKYADMFIGVSSGLSWLSWAVGTPSVLISGFTKPYLEYSTNVERVFNPDVCNGCWNDVFLEFDKGNWDWCPRNRDFKCSKTITPDMVIKSINNIIKNNLSK